ncbi:MAG: hypothetical protein ACI8P3_003142, partial [Saprospiraceae bacterium]
MNYQFQRTSLYLLLIFLVACQQPATPPDNNKEDWIALFNGTDLSGWDIKIADH